jgi:hypothetical protein
VTDRSGNIAVNFSAFNGLQVLFGVSLQQLAVRQKRDNASPAIGVILHFLLHHTQTGS